MKRSQGAVSWQEVLPWLDNMSDFNAEGRIVISRAGPNTIRVVLTVRKRDPSGLWREVVRRGEVIGTTNVDGPAKAALRLAGQCLLDLELELNKPSRKEYQYDQLPLPLPPAGSEDTQ